MWQWICNSLFHHFLHALRLLGMHNKEEKKEEKMQKSQAFSELQEFGDRLITEVAQSVMKMERCVYVIAMTTKPHGNTEPPLIRGSAASLQHRSFLAHP